MQKIETKIILDTKDSKKGTMQVAAILAPFSSLAGITANIISIAISGSTIAIGAFQLVGAFFSLAGNLGDGSKHARKCDKILEIKGKQVEKKIREEFVKKEKNKINALRHLNRIARLTIGISIFVLVIISIIGLSIGNTYLFKIPQVLASILLVAAGPGMKFTEKFGITRLEKELNTKITRGKDDFMDEEAKSKEKERDWCILFSRKKIEINKNTYKIIEKLPTVNEKIARIFEAIDAELLNKKKESFSSALNSKDIINLCYVNEDVEINDIINFFDKGQIEEIKEQNHIYNIIDEATKKTIKDLSKLTPAEMKEINRMENALEARHRVMKILENKANISVVLSSATQKQTGAIEISMPNAQDEQKNHNSFGF